MARFFRRGVSKVYWLPACASPSSGPTAGEFSSGTNLSPYVKEVNGFQLQNSPISTPDLETTFDSQMDGPDTTSDSSLKLYDDKDTSTVRTLLTKGQSGFLLLAPYGIASGKRCEVWPCKSLGFNDEWSMDAVSADAMVQFAITVKPSQSAAMP